MKCCLIFPLTGIFSIRNHFKICYRDPITLLGVLIHTLQGIESILFTYHWVTFKAGVDKMVFAVLLCQTAVFSINIHQLARRWPILNERWCRLETKYVALWEFEDASKRSYRQLFFNFMLFGVLFGTGDFILHVARKYTQAKFEIEFCNTTESVLERIYLKERAHVIRFIGHKTWMIPIIELERLVVINCWNLSIVLIILLSIWLKIRFRQLKERIQLHGGNNNWIDIFNHYQLLVDLVADVDKEVGFIVLQICLHLFLILSYYAYKLTRLDEGLIGTVYLLYQFLSTASITMLIYVQPSTMTDEFEQVKDLLMKVPALEKLHSQILFMNVTFTGNRLYSLSRPTLLTVSSRSVHAFEIERPTNSFIS